MCVEWGGEIRVVDSGGGGGGRPSLCSKKLSLNTHMPPAKEKEEEEKAGGFLAERSTAKATKQRLFFLSTEVDHDNTHVHYEARIKGRRRERGKNNSMCYTQSTGLS